MGSSCGFCQVEMIERSTDLIAFETGESFRISVCPRCGLGQTVPRPVDLSPYYSPGYYGNRHGLTARLCNQRRLNLVRRRMGPGAGRSLLDYGSGNGDFLRRARGDGWSVWGVERHDTVSVSERDAPPVVNDLDALTHLSPFVVATFWHVLEHLNDPAEVLIRLRALLVPGGMVLAAVPNFGSWQSRLLGASWLHLDIPRHLSHFTKTSLIALFENSGYRVEQVIFGEFEYDVIGWSQGILNGISNDRNEFFRRMSGRPSLERRSVGRTLRTAMGLGLSALAVVPAWAESRFGQGGTLIVMARVTPC